MANINNSRAEDGLDTSIQIIFLDLLVEWRTIVAFVAVGISIATVFFFTTSPTYSVNFIAQIGKVKDQPLESTFLAAQMIMLGRFGVGDEKIETSIYELDFDEKKRRTLEVKVSSNSIENTINLAERIVESLHNRHLTLLDKANESDYFIGLPLKIKEERELVQYFEDALAKPDIPNDVRYSKKTLSTITKEYREWLRTGMQFHLNILNRYLNEFEMGSTPTFFPLLPNVKNIKETKPNVNIFISGILGGCFFGVLAAFARKLLNRARQGSSLKYKKEVS